MGGRAYGLSAPVGWCLAGVEIVLAATPLALAVALHLREPSAEMSAVVLVASAGLALWRGWGPDRPGPAGRRRPVHFFVGLVAAVVAVCAAVAVIAAAIEPLGRDASLGVAALASAATVLAAPVAFGGRRRRM